MAGILRHHLLFAALHCCRGGVVEYGRLMIFLGSGEKRGLGKEEWGLSSIKVALQTPVCGTPKRSVTPYQWPFTVISQAPAVEQAQLDRYLNRGSLGSRRYEKNPWRMPQTSSQLVRARASTQDIQAFPTP